MVFTFYPFIKNMGYGLTRKEVEEIAGTRKLGTTIHDRPSTVSHMRDERDSLKDIRRS